MPGACGHAITAWCPALLPPGAGTKLLKSFSLLTARADQPCGGAGNWSFNRNHLSKRDLERSTVPQAVCRCQMKEGKVLQRFGEMCFSLPTCAVLDLQQLQQLQERFPATSCPAHTQTSRELISTTAPMEGQPQCLLHHAMPCASFCSNQPSGRPCPTLSIEPSCDEDKPPASQHRREPSTCPPGRKSLQKHPRADWEPLRWVVPISIRQRA